MDRRAIAVSGIVQGVGFRPLRLRAGDPARPQRLRQEPDRRRPDRGGGRVALPRSVPRRADRRARRPWRGSMTLRWSSRPPRGDRVVPDRAQRARRRQPDLHLARRRDLRRLPGRAVRSRRSPLSLSLPQLHQLRPAADDHHRSALRPRAHDDGRRSRCAPPAAPSTTIPATAASTPSRSPAPRAGRGLRLLDGSGQPIDDVDPLAGAVAALQAGQDRRHQGAGRLSSGLRRRRRGGRGRAAQPQAPR